MYNKWQQGWAGLGWAGLGWAGLDMPGWLRWAVSGVQLCHVTVSPQPADASMGLVTCNTPCHTVCNTVTLYVTLPLHTVCYMLHTKVESCHVAGQCHYSPVSGIVFPLKESL